MTRRNSRRAGAGVPRRGPPHRAPKTTVLLVCEGEKTERNYFDQLKRIDAIRERFAITVKGAKGGSRDRIAQFAVNCKDAAVDDYDEVWCVMDVEGPQEEAALGKALAILQEHEIVSCLSNPAFEVWFLSHFARTAKPFLNYAAVVTELNKLWRKDFSTDYDKTDRHLYRRLGDRTGTAVGNAKWVRETHHGLEKKVADCNSCTEVYRLIERLSGD